MLNIFLTMQHFVQQKVYNMKKIILTILDGFGLSEKTDGNAIKNADTRSIDKLFKEFPNSALKASGEDNIILIQYLKNIDNCLEKVAVLEIV